MEDMVRQQFIEAGVDVDECMNRLMNKEELFVRFMKKYLEDDNIDILADAIKERDVSKAFTAAHTLKGVAGNLSLKGILVPLLPMVETLRAGSMDGVEAAFESTKQAHDKIISQINKI